MATLLVVSGIVTLRNPLVGAAGITLTLSFYLFMSAFTRWIIASAVRPAKGWIAIALSSFITFGLGAFLIATLPVTSLFVPGVFLGVDLLFFGAVLLSFGVSARKLQRMEELESEPEMKRRIA